MCKEKVRIDREIMIDDEHVNRCSGQTLVDWSSESVQCTERPADILYGICQTATFNLKTSNELIKRVRQRLDMPVDAKLSNPAGQIIYDGKLNLDLKFDPKSGPHTVKLDLNRMKNDAIDVDVSFQPRTDDRPMSVNIKANLAQQNPITVQYDETRRSPTNFNGVLKYSFNANDRAAEKSLQCDVDRPSEGDVSVNCKGERTTLTVDIDRPAGKSKIYVDLNRFQGERIGFDVSRNPQTQVLDATLYTLVTVWNVQRQPGRSMVLVVKQKNRDVLRVEGTRINNQEIQIQFSPANVKLKYD
jgi:hypothetical protein